MKSLFYTSSLLLLLNSNFALGQNKEGGNDKIYYQESPGVYRIAKLDGVWKVGPTLHYTTHDPEWQVMRKGENNWNGSFQWLTYLGTDNLPWMTRTHATQRGYKNDSYEIRMESQRPSGAGRNSTFQFLDWSGQAWTVIGLAATKGDDPRPVLIALRKGKF